MRQSGLKGVLEMTEILTGIYSLMKLPVIILTHEKKLINKNKKKTWLKIGVIMHQTKETGQMYLIYIYFYFELISDTWM